MRSEIVMPRSRVEQLVIQEMEDETLVYDLDRHKAHCLNMTAAAIWRRCDGKTSVAQTARALGKEFEILADETVVLLALQQLEKARLLDGPAGSSSKVMSASRRQALKRIGLIGGTAALLPVITSIVAPTPAAAVTCRSPGAACTDSTQCCSGQCNMMVCS